MSQKLYPESLIEVQAFKNNYRYERKYTSTNLTTCQIESILKSHKSFFNEIFFERKINNIYFDTPQMLFHNSNKEGLMVRKKVRIRWYGETFGQIDNPYLEVKLRNNLLGDKWQFPLKGFCIREFNYLAQINKQLRNSSLPPTITDLLSSLNPTLLNSYSRKYFQSSNKEFRVTIDNQLAFMRLSPMMNFKTKKEGFKTNSNHIIELKYNPENDFKANAVSDEFPFRLSKSSKYCDGIDLTHHYL